jgi:sterol desaturase/sphingolipid hydroxylase (fatty acid hydroxylase superfamily)
VVHDFFFYWYHRAQHRWLWRWHSVHHSVTHLNALNSYHHISEPLMSMLMLQLPMALAFADDGPVIPIAAALLWLHIVWIHSPTRVTLGPLRAVLVDNRYHRIHHSLEERHFDKNFGAFTTIWDRLFGTEHMPEKGEWPAVGLADQAPPAGLRAWLKPAAPEAEAVPTQQDPASVALG